MRVRQSNYELRDEVPNFGASEVRKLTSLYTLVIVMAQMAMSEHSELDSFMENVNGKLDEASIDIIRQTLEVNGFTSRLQIKLISERHLELMFQGVNLTMGAKSLLSYHLQVLRDESPLQSGNMKKAQKSSSPDRGTAVDDQCGAKYSKRVSICV